jgi:hypothetical protein
MSLLQGSLVCPAGFQPTLPFASFNPLCCQLQIPQISSSYRVADYIRPDSPEEYDTYGRLGPTLNMARVYADVNQNMPRSYWDYDSVNISEWQLPCPAPRRLAWPGLALLNPIVSAASDLS